jgi:hypothetical protein
MGLHPQISRFLGLKQPLPKAYPRQHPRIQANNLRCSLGAVLDASAGGLRVQLAGKPEIQVGAVMEVAIGPMTAALRPRARVVWVGRSAWSWRWRRRVRSRRTMR